jgi:predicted ribosome quality control (RQC) complex YloA/Tae2 family protein
MALSAGQIRTVLAELNPALTGAWIQKIFQPTAQTLLLETRARGQTLVLLLSVAPATARLHIQHAKLPNPPTPPPFCQYLRAHLQGATIEGFEQINADRIVRIRLTSREGSCSLLAEFTGRRTNLLLLDAQDRIQAALNREQDRAGRLYAPPPARTASESNAEEDLSGGAPPYPVSAAFEARYRDREEEIAVEQLRQIRLASARKALKRARRRVDALKGDLDKAERYREYARYGELLKANLTNIKKGQEQATVVDYYDPTLPELVLPLDPSKGPQGNMHEYFRKHRKYLAAEREIRPRLEAAEHEVALLKKELAALQSDNWAPPAGRTFPAARPSPSRKKERRPEKPPGPFRRFTSADGLPIYVGRNARENEELTFKFAHSGDLWLHARGTPGSHVVVRLEKGAEPPAETIRDAATLALLYSDLKKSGKGEVIYTRRKWVKKMKGQSPGTVSVTQDKSVYATLDRARLDRLKSARER